MRPLREYTLEELRALPVENFVDRDVYPVVDGKAVLPDGRVLAGLHGHTIAIRRMRPAYCVPINKDDPMFWYDENGDGWRPVMTDKGWARTSFRL